MMAIGRSEKNNTSRTEDCDSDLEYNGTEYILWNEYSDFMSSEHV